MINLFWRLIAKLLARPAVTAWLTARAQRTPYLHIMSADGAYIMVFVDGWLGNGGKYVERLARPVRRILR